MELINGNLKQIYKKYLFASFGGAILQSIYGFVDMIMVGWYHGPIGLASMAIIAPIWNVIYSFGLLTGIGASILFIIEKNSSKQDHTKANGYFTVGIILTTIISVLLWLSLILFEENILLSLGADTVLLPLAKSYLIPVKFSLPVFLFMQFMSASLKNDGSPSLVTKGVILGGVFNIIGDYFFVFTLEMGIFGAGLATCIGASLSLLVMLTHFRGTKNTLHLVRPKKFIKKSSKIITLGFSAFFIDIAMGILTMLFNIQIMKHLNSDALAVYGIIVNVSTFVQCCAYGVGQASQPILSASFGELKLDRINKLFRYNVATITVISAFWLILTLLFPTAFVYLFTNPSESVLIIAPSIIRLYCISFALLPFNIYSTYYFQATMKADIAFIISILRGLIISGALILALPILISESSIWLAMPITELVTFVYICAMLKRTNKKIE